MLRDQLIIGGLEQGQDQEIDNKGEDIKGISSVLGISIVRDKGKDQCHLNTREDMKIKIMKRIQVSLTIMFDLIWIGNNVYVAGIPRRI